MGLRSAKRQIAKARMKIVGFEHINKNFSIRNTEGVPNWKLALMDENAHRIQTAYSRRIKRKIKRVGV
jgi:hypothetical protein